MRTILAGLCLLCSFLRGTASTQDAVPIEMMNRTLLINNGNQYGTAFKFDHQGRIYLVTARHMVEGMSTSKATFQVWRDNGWQSLPTIKTLFPKSNDVDIAVLMTDETIAQPYEITAKGRYLN